MVRTKQYLFVFIILISACNNVIKKQKEVFINNELIVTIPGDWKLEEKKGIDSYVFRLSDNNGGVIKGDLGKFVNRLNEPAYPVFDFKLKDSLLKRAQGQLDLNTIHFSDFPDEDSEERIFSKQFYVYDTINGILAKLVLPKRTGKGV